MIYMNKNIIVAGIQLICNDTKENMLKKVEQYIKDAFKRCKNIDIVVLPEQFYQIIDSKIEESITISEQQVEHQIEKQIEQQVEQHIEQQVEHQNEHKNKEKCQNISSVCHENIENEHENLEFWVKKMAKKYSVNIVAGSYPVKTSHKVINKVKNRCLVANRKGEIVGFYDKIHLFDAFGVKESNQFESGNTLGTFSLDCCKIGVWICYDTRFPEVARALANADVDLFCVPAAFYKPNTEHWETMLKSAAITNITPLIAVNQYGDLSESAGFVGRSQIIDAKGVKTAGISDKEGYFIGEVDLDYTAKCKKENPCMRNQRRDLYQTWMND